MFYWLLKHLLMGPLMRLGCRPRVVGSERLPTSGAAILASNHLAVADSFFIPLIVPRRVTFLAKREYFVGRGVKGAVSRFFFSAAGQVPIDRSSGSTAQAALDTAVRLLRKGKLLGIYPEGTRSPDGRLYKGKTGVARIALETGVPVVPVVMVGTDRVSPAGAKMWKPHRVEVRFGAPLDFSRYAGLGGNPLVERAIVDEIMYALMELSGQEYVDRYATSIKKGRVGRERPEEPALKAS